MGKQLQPKKRLPGPYWSERDLWPWKYMPRSDFVVWDGTTRHMWLSKIQNRVVDLKDHASNKVDNDRSQKEAYGFIYLTKYHSLLEDILGGLKSPMDLPDVFLSDAVNSLFRKDFKFHGLFIIGNQLHRYHWVGREHNYTQMPAMCKQWLDIDRHFSSDTGTNLAIF